MPRLFTGLEIPPDIALRLSAYRGGLPGARWIDPENYHITLRFIGDIDNATARDVVLALSEGRPREPVAITLDELGAFGGARPRVVHASVKATTALTDLHMEQERLLDRVGLAPEGRKFKPHVTLARLRSASPADLADYLAARPFPPLSFAAARIILYSSRASVGGGPYVIEAAYPLG